MRRFVNAYWKKTFSYTSINHIPQLKQNYQINMKDFSLKELQAIREAMEELLSSDEDFQSALKKIDEELEKMGYRFERRAFESRWKKIENK